MKTLEPFIKSPEAIEYLARNMVKLWCEEFQLYTELGPRQKGAYGEFIAGLFFRSIGSIVHSRINSGHDYIIDGYKTEIKFSGAMRDDNNGNPVLNENTFTLNHLALRKDWDRLVFIGVNPDDKEDVIFWITKEDAIECVEKGLYIKKQQGGKQGDNDDYISTSDDLMKLYYSNYAKTIDQWNGDQSTSHGKIPVMAKPSLLDFLT